VAGCEDYYLVFLTDVLQALDGVGSNVDAGLDDFLVREFEVDYVVACPELVELFLVIRGGIVYGLLHAVDQGLIKVEDDYFPDVLVSRLRQENLFRLDFFLRRLS
jgi:hypothetical protein